ncbi:uncharacterized protein LOC111444863 [Cucurbita moschata]|uniref:Uncharacterized protein LOC111444863 n=1 Tax=Cucurbita moschata TaxID=3662 RepID=A0A6J1FEW1_CUCMO|nr:uncharacterized protein LOC111444863 [Cucurbita moschata]
MNPGISSLIGLKAAALFSLFLFLRFIGFRLLSFQFLYASLVSLLISVASLPSINLPLLLGKKPDGTFPIWSIVIFAPFLLFIRYLPSFRGLYLREDPYTEIFEGLYVGGWPTSPDRLPPCNPAIVDCTCELPRCLDVSGDGYLCIPTWDTRSPLPEEIESAVRWICRKREQKKPVFIHCAYGHGRSVVVTCAVLVAFGAADDWKNAEKIVKEKRPCIHMNSTQCKALEEWSKHRLSAPMKKKDNDVSSMLLSGS